MSGVFWCCCVGAPPTICDCSCVCDEPFAITHPDTGEYLGVWRDEQLVAGQEWTIVFWTFECAADTEGGVQFHQYKDPETPTTIRLMSFPTPGDPTKHRQEMLVEIRYDDGTLYGYLSVYIDYPLSISGCKMRAFRFRTVADPISGQLVPERDVTVYVDSTPNKYHANLIEDGELLEDDLGFFPQATQKTYLGSLFPLDDPRYNVNLGYFAGCISNFQIYSAFLSDATLDSLWNSGAGVIPTTGVYPDLEEQWCADAPWWQDSTGTVAGTVIKHEGGIWDQNGDMIQDGNGKIIHGIN